MGLIEVASGESVWHGMDYYEERKSSAGKKQVMNNTMQNGKGQAVIRCIWT